MSKKKVAVVLVNRANYGRLKPVMRALQRHGKVAMQVICAGSMLLDRFGRARDVVEADGFPISAEVYLEVEGSVGITMTKSTGLAVIEFASELQRLQPDFVLVIGDRYEAIAAAIAAVFLNSCLIHLQGGEVSGSIDESIRHAITKFAHYHFPATERAAGYIEAMGEDPSTIFALGCPSCDVVREAPLTVPVGTFEPLGVGRSIDFSEPYLLVLFHPVTTDQGTQEAQMQAVLDTVLWLGMQTVVLWPNIDAGADLVSQAIRRFREYHHDFCLHAYKNVPPEAYVPLLRSAACCIGNSSSFVRETSFLGTPVVLVGSRQDGREWSPSVVRVEPTRDEILAATEAQLRHGRYPTSALYGEGEVGEKIAAKIATLAPYSQKQLHYVRRWTSGEPAPQAPFVPPGS
jgi:UDP-hydrolysing UDP-N-acetyl-D-glucosamine 2-epimerase